MEEQVVRVNRAPVLTLWATVVAEQLGHDRDTALTLGRTVAGLNAQSKGRALGIFEGGAEPKKEGPPKHTGRGEDEWVPLLGRLVPVKQTDDGLRAMSGDDLVEPAKVSGYLRRAFGDKLAGVEAAMRELAESLPRDDLEVRAYGLYEQFRPEVEPGGRGWGQKGQLDLARIRGLAER